MSLLWADGFDTYGTGNNSAVTPAGVLARKYATVGGSHRTKPGRYSAYALKFQNSSAYIITPDLGNTDSTIILGVAEYFQSFLLSSDYLILGFYDGGIGGTLGMNVVISGTNMKVRRNTTVLDTFAHGLSTDTWYTFEFKVVVDNATGSYELRIGTSTVSSDSGIDTQSASNAYYDTARLGGTQSSETGSNYADDFYVLNGAGSNNNDFLGEQRIITLLPSADTADADWTPDTGVDNHDRVDEAELDDDTSYVESAVSDDLDLYEYDNLPTGVIDIKGAMISTDCRQSDANAFDLKSVAKSGSTQSDGAGETIGTSSYTTLVRMLEEDPDTSALWTPAAINAATFGVKVG